MKYLTKAKALWNKLTIVEQSSIGVVIFIMIGVYFMSACG